MVYFSCASANSETSKKIVKVSVDLSGFKVLKCPDPIPCKAYLFFGGANVTDIWLKCCRDKTINHPEYPDCYVTLVTQLMGYN